MLCARIEAENIALTALPSSLQHKVDEILAKEISDGNAGDDWGVAGLFEEELGMTLEREVSPFESGSGGSEAFLAVDLACRAKKLAVELDGPSHFVTVLSGGEGGEKWRENGATKMKTRLLRKLGWTVVRVPHFEWFRLRGKQRKVAYLKSRLAACSAV